MLYEFRENDKGIKQRRKIGTKRWLRCCQEEGCGSSTRDSTGYCKKHGGIIF